jgi:hypothetical protein
MHRVLADSGPERLLPVEALESGDGIEVPVSTEESKRVLAT